MKGNWYTVTLPVKYALTDSCWLQCTDDKNWTENLFLTYNLKRVYSNLTEYSVRDC